MKGRTIMFLGIALVTSAAILGVCWYLFPRQFYWVDEIIASTRSIDIETPTPQPNTLESFEQFIANELNNSQIPGAAIAIIVDDEIVWQQTYGYADLETKTTVTADTAFQLGSISKAYLGVAIAQAIENEYFGLDDDINAIMPFNVQHPIYPDTPITIRHLVSHTSGIRDSLAYYQSYGIGELDTDLGVFLADYLVPGGKHYRARGGFTNQAPGAAYEYSNVGAGLAAYVLEVATQTPFSTYMCENVFQPLNMANTGYFQNEFGPDSVIASAYLRQNMPYGYTSYPTYPDGMIRASVADVALFLTTIMNDGTYQGTTILSPQSAELLLSPVSDVAPHSGIFWEVAVGRNGTRYGHDGGDPGALAFMYFDRDRRIGTVLLMNSDTFQVRTMAFNILNLIFNGEHVPDIFSAS